MLPLWPVAMVPLPREALVRAASSVASPQTQTLFSSDLHLTEARQAWSKCPLNWEYFK